LAKELFCVGVPGGAVRCSPPRLKRGLRPSLNGLATKDWGPSAGFRKARPKEIFTRFRAVLLRSGLDIDIFDFDFTIFIFLNLGLIASK
jgi:hypothetical protein